MKKLLIILGVLLLVSGCSSSEQKKEINFEGKTVIHKGQDFKQGTYDSVVLKDNNTLELKKGVTEGWYTSPIINTSNFREIVGSWNAITSAESKVELFVQVRKDGEWSEWFSYGKWSVEGNRGSIKGQRDKIANMAIDTLTLLGGKEGDGLRYKIALYRNNQEEKSPEVSLVAIAIKLGSIPAIATISGDDWIKDIEVPARSQMVVPTIGNSICSPTSLSMVMEYYGQKMDTELVAERARDYGAGIYGNWSYNVAYAGSMGFDSYIEIYYSIDEIKAMIAKNTPVVASIKTGSAEELTGSPMAYPSGHLLVVRGFKLKDGVEYIIVNDPAAPGHDSVVREYKLSEFEKAWRNVVYIVKPR